MKSILNKIALLAIICVVVFALVAYGEKKEENRPAEGTETTQKEGTSGQPSESFNDEDVPEINVPKSEQEGTAGSNIPLKDNFTEAEYQIKVAMQDLLKEAYGEDVFDARFNVEKIYTYEDEQEVEALKERNLGANEVAFEVKYEIKPAQGVDPIKFTAANGEYDEESGWVKEKYNLGILRPASDGEAKYVITDFGTGW